MIKVLVATIALFTVFSMPALAALTGPGSAPRFRDSPDVSRNQGTERRASSGPVYRKAEPDFGGHWRVQRLPLSGSHDLDCE
jgi:hypothetical protein